MPVSGKSGFSFALCVLVLEVYVEHKGFSCRTLYGEAACVGFFLTC